MCDFSYSRCVLLVVNLRGYVVKIVFFHVKNSLRKQIGSLISVLFVCQILLLCIPGWPQALAPFSAFAELGYSFECHVHLIFGLLAVLFICLFACLPVLQA